MTHCRCGSPASNALLDFLSFDCLEITVKNHLGDDAFFVLLKIKNKWRRRNEKLRIRLWQQFLRLRAQRVGLHVEVRAVQRHKGGLFRSGNRVRARVRWQERRIHFGEDVFLRLEVWPAVLLGDRTKDFVEEVPALITVRHDDNSLAGSLRIRLQSATEAFVRAAVAESQLVPRRL